MLVSSRVALIGPRLTLLLASAVCVSSPLESQRPRVDSASVERIVDSVLTSGMRAERIPGAAFCFVQPRL
jgi:hypothetical protein